MEIFFRLVFGHLLADFTLQTNYIARWKRDSIYGLLVHVFIHPICYIPLTWPYLGQTWITYGGVALGGWTCVAIASALHFVADWIRIRLINNGWPDNTVFYFSDQIIHLTVLYFLTPFSTQGIVDSWPILGILFVGVTHFSTVTVWFIEKDIYGRSFPETEEKYLSMLQRLVIWLFFFLPSPWWFVGPTVSLVLYGNHIRSKKIDFSWTSVILGNTFAVVAGLVARFGLNSHF